MPLLDVVIDLSHHNRTVDLARAKAAGIVGVIHKASQGVRMRDSKYAANCAQAVASGLLWGAYHFGVNGSGRAQAEHFLSVVNPTPDTLLVLDYEPNATPQATMSLGQAREFVECVVAETGRWPGLYSGALIKEQLRNKPVDQVLAKCWLWIAQYGPRVRGIPPTWNTHTMWQYTQTGRVDGIPGAVDRNRFNGTLEGLKRLWQTNPILP